VRCWMRSPPAVGLDLVFFWGGGVPVPVGVEYGVCRPLAWGPDGGGRGGRTLTFGNPWHLWTPSLYNEVFFRSHRFA